MLRFRTKDITSINYEPCKCGRTSARMHKIIGRTDDMIKVRGVNVFPSQVESALIGVTEISPNYLLVLRRENYSDSMEVRVELIDGSLLEKYGELEALHAVCKARHLPLFIDGARLGAALYSPVCDYTLADMAHMCEVFTIGGTKMGLLFGEAAVFSAPELAKDFRYFIKQNGGMLAKGRLLGVQFYAAFKDGLYDRIGAEEVRLALRLRDGFRARGWTFLVESPSNQQFPVMKIQTAEKLAAMGFEFQVERVIDEEHIMYRFVTSWATPESAIDDLLNALAQCQ